MYIYTHTFIYICMYICMYVCMLNMLFKTTIGYSDTWHAQDAEQ